MKGYLANHEGNPHEILEAFIKHMSVWAKHNLTEMDQRLKNIYISNDAWNLVEERYACRTQGGVENKQTRLSKETNNKPMPIHMIL